MKRIIGTILFIIYAIIAITVTVLLLSFNNYNCSEIGEYTIYIVKNDALEPEYKQGSILLIKNTDDRHVQVGDTLYFYKVIDSQEYEFVQRTLKNKTQQGRHIVYNVSEEETYDSTFFIGRAEDTVVIEGPWGTILSILESKWGYLFCIVIVSLLLFLQETFDLYIEIKYGKTNEENAETLVETKEQLQPKAKSETSTQAKKQLKPKTTASTQAKTTTNTQIKKQTKPKATTNTQVKKQTKPKATTSAQTKKQLKEEKEEK